MPQKMTPDEAALLARDVFNSGYSWAQSVLHVLQEAQGFPCITELASGFGGGIGREQDVCGAIAGGTIAIGYRAGQGKRDQKEIADAARPAARRMYEGFRARFGAVDCRELTGFDFNVPEGYQQFQASDKKNEVCHPCVEFVVRTILADNE
jgi:C_GCAxxG_C_C family probable redox protein